MTSFVFLKMPIFCFPVTALNLASLPFFSSNKNKHIYVLEIAVQQIIFYGPLQKMQYLALL
uniref:Uncharacterized protein n=1 Tax=Anguilla anguilla TaxID=7936 RepID=A0A0E9R470_ANGAN